MTSLHCAVRGALVAALLCAVAPASPLAQSASNLYVRPNNGGPFQPVEPDNPVPVGGGAPGGSTAPVAIGNSAGLFAATTTSTAVTLTLPGKVRFVNPQYLVGTLTPNTTPLQLNYTGGNACTTPNATLSPGQFDDWVYIPTTVQPTICIASGSSVEIEAQQ